MTAPWRPRCSISSSSSPRSPSPSGEERAVADRVLGYLRDCGLAPDEDDAGPRGRLDDGEHLRRARADGRGRAALPLRPPRHRAADGRDRAGRRGRHRPQRAADDPRRRQQGRRRGDARGDAACPRREPPARRDRAPLHPKEEVGPARRLRLRPHAAARAGRATSTTRRRRSATSSSARPRRSCSRSRFHGRAAHAGMYPEEGRSAIAAAARAISEMRLGRIDEETTANVGMITRRHGREHRPGVVLVRRRGALARRAEARRAGAGDAGRDHVRGRRRRVRGRDAGASATTARTGSSATTCRCGSRPRRSGGAASSRATRLSGGAADANVFNERGLAVREPRERDGRDPHAGRAHRRRRPRGDGRGDARADRRPAAG